ncbi:MAG: SDR family NAD(P)-dependent oxidoreductase [Frankia sp.]
MQGAGTVTTQNKIAIITGANRGLGRSTALKLAEDGVDVILTYRSNLEEADAVVARINGMGRRAVAFQLDTGKAEAFEQFTTDITGALKEHWGRDHFDFLINNAGAGILTPFGQTTPDAVDELMNVHFKGVFFLTQALAPSLADGGRIITLSTGLARFTNGDLSVYAAMKGAIEVLTRYLAKALGSRGITVNAVAPGPVATDFGGGFVRDNAQVRDHLGSQAALGRVGLPEDIAGVVAALLAPGTGWITGQRIEASGGAFL